MGRFGDEFLKSAADQCLAGIAANDLEESVVILCNFIENLGEPLTGAHNYELMFPKGLEPPVDVF